MLARAGTWPRVPSAVVSAACTLSLAGCALCLAACAPLSPGPPTRPRATTPGPAGSGRGVLTETVEVTPGGPPEVVSAFADAYINWSSDTVSADMRGLAGRSIGQARSAMQLAAAQTAGDYELQRGAVANHGTVEAVSPLPRARGQYIVVTREQTTAAAGSGYAGLAPAWHVALATVTEVAPGRWAVSAWQPQS